MKPKFEVVTSMNQSYYDKIGREMLVSYISNWSSDIKLRIYHEDELQQDISSRLSYYNLFDVEPELKKFVDRHKDRPDQQNNLELHYGAVRFSYKTFSILHAGYFSPADYVIWLDADTRTYNYVGEEFLNSLISPDKYLTYLGRENNYSECGFVIYNTTHPGHRAFQTAWRHLYESDEVFKLDQWHDSYVFDQVRKTYEKDGIIENINLSPWGKNYDHVFINSKLGEYMDHMKGPRKEEGKSRESDLLSKEPKSSSYNNYWDIPTRF